MEEMLINYLGSLIVILFLAIVKAVEMIKAKKKKSASNLAISNEFNMRLYPVLWNMLSRYKCMRILIYQFHNGEFFYSGHHIQRVTCSHEVQIDGVFQVKEMMQGIMVPESMHYILAVLRNYSYYYVDDIDSSDTDKRVKAELSICKIKSAIYLPIKNPKGDIIALQVLHYNYSKPLNDDQINDLLFRANKVNNIFTTSRKELK